ncbi:DUF5959 family protein [Streptomyces sp. WA6-1-16]|uniref:DUF5959 family protein n=1 Tax=Streptomyces sp. WA6-1-16 TaxID=2879427 RepID=UPI001CE26483|nr:DUF5959 family protein [Streptomyces sp. WA6-1-16]UCA51417.1 DUF5959 family protein [Streptomyces sp. WA6-1-16]
MEGDLGELIYLADPPGTSGHVVSLRVLALPVPGGDVLDCEFVVETETVKGSFPVHVTSDDLDDWEEALGALAGNRFVSWLNWGRTVQFKIKPVRHGVIAVSVHDGPSSQVTVSVPLFPATGWIDDQRARLEKVRRLFSG